MNRRELIGTVLACGAMQVAPRGQIIQRNSRADSCAPDSGIVNWTPDVLRPVSFGFKNYGPPDAPMPLRIFYPSHQPFTEGGAAVRPLLKMCGVRWPLVLFLHGRPPCDSSGVTEPNCHLRWTRFATVLAKSGYVVAVPSYEAPHPDNATDPTIARAMSVIDWVRGIRIDSSDPGATARAVGPLSAPRWENADWVHPRATAVAGHSFGALLAARIAQTRPSISSFVSLSGGFVGRDALISTLDSIQARKFFMWTALEGNGDLFREDLDAGGVWSGIPQPKHVAIHAGEHFDYLRPDRECGVLGLCAAFGDVAADLVALFIARHTPVGASPSIPFSLVPPDTDLTPSQQFFIGTHLSSFSRFDSESGCRLTVRWETPEESGMR